MTPDEVAERWGTPTYVYDLAAVRRQHTALRSNLPSPGEVYFSLKANPHPDIAAEMASLGTHAEVSSSGELGAALRGGFEPARVMMTGPGKVGADVGEAIDLGIRRFSVESARDLALVAGRARAAGVRADVLLRVNADDPVPGMGLTMTGGPSQFGVDASALEPVVTLARTLDAVRLRGVHLYMGTNLGDLATLRRQFIASLTLARALLDRFALEVDEINLGGGFGAPFAREGPAMHLNGLGPTLTDALDDSLPAWRDRAPTVSFESGRFLTASCGTLVCRVLDVKRSKDRCFVVLDGGIHQLGGMSGLRRVPRISPTLVTAGSERRAPVEEYTVVGPLCTPLDTWTVGALLPAPALGDLVTVPNVGAYGLTASLIAFLGHPPAVEVVHDSGTLRSASRLSMQRVPVAASRAPS